MGRPQRSRVALGSRVRVSGFEPGETEMFHLVPESEVNYLDNRIPVRSPLAQTLYGAKVGDKVLFRPPGRWAELTVLEIQ
jgi:transcription elongation GreA/GreB family factor